MPRKKKIEVEVLPAEPAEEAKPLKQVEAKHTITYIEPVSVPSEIEEEEESEENDVRTERTRRPASFREKFREKAIKHGIGKSDILRLRIARLPHYNQDGQ